MPHMWRTFSYGINQLLPFRHPLLSGNAIDNALAARCDDLVRAISGMRLLSARDALTRIQDCFSAPKIMYILRCSPYSEHIRLRPLSSRVPICYHQYWSNRHSVYQSELMDWEFAVLLPHLWLLLLAYAILILSSYSTVIRHQILTSTWRSCYEPHLVTYHCLSTQVPSKNMHRTDPLSRLIRLPCGQFSLTASIELDYWPSLCNKAATGCTPSPWLHVKQVSTTRQFGLPSGYTLESTYVKLICVLVAHCFSRDLSCKRNSGRSIRRPTQWSDLVSPNASIPSIKEPAGLPRSDGKRPHGLSHRDPRSINFKEPKFFHSEMGNRLTVATNVSREESCMFQRISILIPCSTLFASTTLSANLRSSNFSRSGNCF